MNSSSNEPKFEASSYAEFRPTYPAEIFAKLRPLLTDQVGQPFDVLDLGCGTGLATHSLIKAFELRSPIQFHLIDPDPQMLAIAENTHPKTSAQWNLKIGSAEKIPLTDQSVDLILVGSAFHWFKAKAIEELNRVARPGAHLMIFEYQFPRAVSHPDLNQWVKSNFNLLWKAPHQTPRGKLKDLLKPLHLNWQLTEVQSPPMVLSLDFEGFFGHLVSQSRYQHYESTLPSTQIPYYRADLKKQLSTFWREGLISFDFYLQSFSFVSKVTHCQTRSVKRL